VKDAGEQIGGIYFQTGIGVAFPGGDLGGDLGKVSDAAVFHIPIDINVGYRFNDHVAAAVFVLLSPVWPNPDFMPCSLRATCGGLVGRLGLHGQFHFAPRASIDPWLSAGSGWELLVIDEDTESSTGVELSRSVAFNGPLLADLRLGLDFTSGAHGWGPYVGMSTGTYWTLVTNCDFCAATQTSTSIPERELFHWFAAGVQGWFAAPR
jgi:hypothetical protein